MIILGEDTIMVDLIAFAMYGDKSEDGSKGIVRIYNTSGTEVDTVLFTYTEDGFTAGMNIQEALAEAGYTSTGSVTARQNDLMATVRKGEG